MIIHEMKMAAAVSIALLLWVGTVVQCEANAPPAFKPFVPIEANSGLRGGPYHFDVTPNGAAIWSMPIWTPSGRLGIEPHLKLNYSSQAGSGLLGVGFSLSGLSSIDRCWKRPAIDGTYSTPAQPGVPDAFCLDNQRLVPRVGGTEFELQPETDQSLLVRVIGSLSAPRGFQVYYADGRIAHYGLRDNGANGSASRLQAKPLQIGGDRTTGDRPAWASDLLHEYTNPDQVTTISWNFDYLEDRYGNYLEVDYERTITASVPEEFESVPYPRIKKHAVPESVELVPKEIRWTGNRTGPVSLPPTRRLKFTYAPVRLDRSVDSFRSGIMIRQSLLLYTIEVFAQDRLVSDNDVTAGGTERLFRAYRITYENRITGTGGVNRLTSVRECVSPFTPEGGERCEGAAEFAWAEKQPAKPKFRKGSHHDDGLGWPRWFAAEVLDSVVGDLNGDGRDDYLYRLPALRPDGKPLEGRDENGLRIARGEWYVRLGSQDGLGQRLPTKGLPASAGGDWRFSARMLDIEADGKSEVLLYREPLPPTLGGQPDSLNTKEWNAYRGNCTATSCTFTSINTATSCTLTSIPGWGECASIEYVQGFPRRSFLLTVGDFDGDGRPDTLHEKGGPGQSAGSETSLLFRRGSRQVGQIALDQTATPIQENIRNIVVNTLVGLYGERHVIDVDGNGRPELVTPTLGRNNLNTFGVPPTFSILSVLPQSTSGGSTNRESSLHALPTEYSDIFGNCGGPAPPFPPTQLSRWFLDFNGDGLKDSVAVPSMHRDRCPGPRNFQGQILVSQNTGGMFRAAVKKVLKDQDSINPTLHCHPQEAEVQEMDPRCPNDRLHSMDPGVRIGDIDRDGREDILLVSTSNFPTPSRKKPGGMVLLRWNGITFVGTELSVPLAGNYWDDFTGQLDTYSGGYGPRLTQLGDFNGDGLTDIVTLDVKADSSNQVTSYLQVYLQEYSAPEVIISFDMGPHWPRISVDYAWSTIAGSTVYTSSMKCQWPQICHKSMGWVVQRHSVEAAGFGERWIQRNVFLHGYSGARSDGLRQQSLGVERYVRTAWDDSLLVPPKLLGETVYEFDQATTVRHESGDGFPRYGYTQIGQPTRVRHLVELENGAVHVRETETQRSWSALPGSFGYHITSSMTVTTESEGAGWSPDVLSSTRVQRSYDKYGTPVSTTTEVSPSRIPVTGVVDRSQLLSRTEERMVGPNNANTSKWLVSRYEKVEFESFLPSLPEVKQKLLRTTSIAYVPNSVEPMLLVVEPDAVKPELETESGFRLVTFIPRNIDGTVLGLIEIGSGSLRGSVFRYDENDRDRIYPTIHTNVLGQTSTSWSHAALGVVVAQDDPNGVRTEYRYEGSGRVREIRAPGVPPTMVKYFVPDTTPSSRTRWEERRIEGTDTFLTKEVDPYNRVVSEAHSGFDQTVKRAWSYDRFGNLATTYLPYYTDSVIEPPFYSRLPHVSYTYDLLGRILSRSRPGDTDRSPALTSTSVYEGRRSRTVNERGITSMTEMDALGRAVRQQTFDPVTSRDVAVTVDYGHLGLPWRITQPALPPSQDMTPSAGALETVMGYDRLGRRESINDPHTGLSLTRYNAFGEVKNTLDANGVTSKYFYDALGRLKRIETPASAIYPSPLGNAWAQRTTFTWDSAPNGIGQLHRAKSNDGVGLEFQYDPLSRLAKQTYTMSDRSYSFGYDYNQQGQLHRLTYPSSTRPFMVEYAYAANGNIREAHDVSSQKKPRLLWTQLSRNSAGQSTREQFGVAEDVTREYDATGRLRFVHGTFLKDGTTFQKLSYKWGLDGLLDKRTDLVVGVQEEFRHDFLNRLEHWKIRQNCIGITWQYVYDDWGNLRSRQPIEGLPNISSTTCEYTTPSHPGQPHAVKQLTQGTIKEEYRYLPSGEMTIGRDVEFQWTPFGLPSQIRHKTLGLQAQFVYDPSGSRVVRQEKVPGLTRRTTSLQGLFETIAVTPDKQPEEVQQVYNVVAGSGVVAQVRRQAGTMSEATLFIHPDHLGSPDVITAETSPGSTVPSAIVDRSKYEPFGERRYPWAMGQPMYQPFPKTATFGFTGHQSQDAFGLIDMAGRYYDPHISRFISSDPILSIGSSQSLNPYSYVMNSTVSLVDPSGFSAESGDWRHEWKEEDWDPLIIEPETKPIPAVPKGFDPSLRPSPPAGGTLDENSDAGSTYMLNPNNPRAEFFSQGNDYTKDPIAGYHGGPKIVYSENPIDGRQKALFDLEFERAMAHVTHLLGKRTQAEIEAIRRQNLSDPSIPHLSVGPSRSPIDNDAFLGPMKRTGQLDAILNYGLLPFAGAKLVSALTRLPASGIIDTDQVRFTQSSISHTLRTGEDINDVISALRGPGGDMLAKDFNPIRIFERNGQFYTLDNRRLAIFDMANRNIPFIRATQREVYWQSWKFTATPHQQNGLFIRVK